MYDVFFISYDEPNADMHWKRLLEFSPNATRIHGIKGILAAHKAAAELSKTDAFFVVDADAYIVDSWSFIGEEFDEFTPYSSKSPADCVIVWQSRNPYNNLEYGYGGLKLMSKKEMLRADGKIDVATSVSKCFLSVDTVSCETRFASDSWHAWRGAFRECAKLSSASVGQMTNKQKKWLDTWTSYATGEFADMILAGAIAGREYGSKYKQDHASIALINDYNWMKNRYEQSFPG
jgi:hypothetical protein